jgi:hypothetical protein
METAMKNVVNFGIAAVVLASGLSMGASAFATEPGVVSSQEPPEGAREIVITPSTKYLNVEDGETVKITNAANGQSFVWTVDTLNDEVVSLNSIAPAGDLDHNVVAYVSNPAALED